jgi:threonine aldolase
MAFNSLVSVRLVDGDRGRFTPDDVLKNINPEDVHFPITKLVIIENTVNKGGGSCYTLEQAAAIKKVATEHNLRMHLDGARLFNALAETNEEPKSWGTCFDTISICLSKGLGAPVGSVLCGSEQHIMLARRIRKVLGGGMRQAGYLAAAGIYALKHHVKSLTDDNRKARALGNILNAASFVKNVHPVDTNIVIFEVNDHLNPMAILDRLTKRGIHALPFGGQEIRMVTHREITDEMVGRFEQVIKSFIL